MDKKAAFTKAKVMGAMLDSGILAPFAKQAKDMPHFTEQDRPAKVKEIYKAIKRDHPEYPAELKARIASSKGEGGGEGPKEFKKDKGRYVKKGELVSFLEKALTKEGSAGIIKKASDPELAARVIWAIRIAAGNG